MSNKDRHFSAVGRACKPRSLEKRPIRQRLEGRVRNPTIGAMKLPKTAKRLRLILNRFSVRLRRCAAAGRENGITCG